MSALHPNRPDMLKDLTRWNRMGLSRFDYIDGDAAVWLEELRIAMLGLYLHGVAGEARLPEYWRDVYLKPVSEWPDVADAAQKVAWKRLAPVVPPQRETRGRRTERLLKQYDTRTGDYAWEINRAFARAAHILLGYLDAYTNEGYLRTATQWDNLRRLAAMVNYQPTPYASATTLVGLILNDDTGAVEVPAGLAMKYTKPEGGAPVIFETLTKVSCHPALNAARAKDWNRNNTPIAFGNAAGTRWFLAKDKTLATGDLMVLADGKTAEAHILRSVNHDTDAGIANLIFADQPGKTYTHYSTRLWTLPSDVRVGEKTSKNGQVVVKVEGMGSVVAGDLVEVMIKGEKAAVEVLMVTGDGLVLDMDLGDEKTVKLRLMQPYALDAAKKVKRQATGTTKMAAPTSNGVKVKSGTSPEFVGGTELREFSFSKAKHGRAYAFSDGDKQFSGTVVKESPAVVPTKDKAKKSKSKGHGKKKAHKVVSFTGKPPKGLADGDWFVARDMATDAVKALRVKGVRVASGEYHVEFHAAPVGAPDKTEFHGPMTLSMIIENYNRNPAPALAGNKLVLEHVPEAARVLIKPGRKLLIRRQVGEIDETIAAKVEEARPATGGPNRLELTLMSYEGASQWARGDLSFCLNTVQVSHGESKGSKLLGSGDGERRVQSFDFNVKNISHIPSTSAEAGVAPAMDIAVDGVRWEYRDYIDPSAEGTPSWSTTLTEDDTLRIHFRRRLVTGQNNVIVTRYRVGAGAAGSAIPPLSFSKPMKKNRYVSGIFQPFATAGGADREPVSKLRESTPKRLSANGRAVSLSDFEHLAMRHSAILRAHAEIVPTSASLKLVSLTVALANGADVDDLKDDLSPGILAKALPGVGVSFRNYECLPLRMVVKVRSDLAVYNKTDIKAAAEARLFEVFALEKRDFGQTVYISEVLAALETVVGVETARVLDFGLVGQGYTDLTHAKPADFDGPWPRNVAVNDGKVAAIYTTLHQIAHIVANSASAVAVEVEDAR
ncbi:hypothetical protein [Kordiimonas marina]|uniref:hypothetical protein n=1 Tax=Kordiimonas marina TaxID=2872312 RepID=UPI001FF19B29|nr:hypothetical protein [Kordiimonas marina]MCJ9429310.1 hypothetical protein [Kordiimonas marina]